MKKIKHFLSLAFVLIFSMASLVFAEETTIQYDEEKLKSDAQSLYIAFFSMSDVEAEYVIDNIPGVLGDGVKSFESVKAVLGEYDVNDVKAEEFKVEGHEDNVQIIVTGTLKNEQIQMTVEYRVLLGELQRYKISFELVSNDKSGLGERMLDALLNTVIGLTTVFLVLILIAFVIWLFKFIPAMQRVFAKLNFISAIKKKRNNKRIQKNEDMDSVDNTVAQIDAREEAENLTDDLELVAVIAAAIAAYEETDINGFVVRSIKKSHANKWRKA